nr:hypothetical protein [Tanacetum cinerariifolium]
EEGIDYEEVFVLVVRIEAIRLFLAYAIFIGFMVYQMDVKSAFLYGTIKEKVYVCQPLGFKDPNYPDKENGFQRGKIDQTLFIKKQKDDILLVQVYVDDIIFGLQVKQKPDGMFINQDKDVAEILRMFGLTDGKSASTPIDTKKPLLNDSDGENVDVHTYRSMIGSLMYLTSSRPDIMVGKGFYRVETPLFKGMIVAQQADDVADEGVAGVDVDNEGVDAADAEPSIPSPTSTTQPPPSKELPSTSQVIPTPPTSPIAQPSSPP